MIVYSMNIRYKYALNFKKGYWCVNCMEQISEYDQVK